VETTCGRRRRSRPVTGDLAAAKVLRADPRATGARPSGALRSPGGEPADTARPVPSPAVP
jgi:hypothetical protein